MVSLYRASNQTQPRAPSYSGTSADEKPINIENGSWFYEIDTSNIYRYDAQYNIWYIQPDNGGGQIIPVIQELNVTENGVYEVPEGVNGYNPVVVNVSNTPQPPDDGKTRLYITVPANAMEGLPPPRNEVPLYIQQTVDRGVTIDWGDGSEPETLPGTGIVNTTHTYEHAGDYIISLDPAEGCTLGLGTGDNSKNVIGSVSLSAYSSQLKKVSFGTKGIGSIGAYAFYKCISLNSIFVPENIDSIGFGAFGYCECLSFVTIQSPIKTVSNSVFLGCISLPSLLIPETVTKIVTNAFFGCTGMKEYHFMSTTPPSLSSASAFSEIPSDCIIYVPKGSVDAYKSATNWTEYADQMQEEPA